MIQVVMLLAIAFAFAFAIFNITPLSRVCCAAIVFIRDAREDFLETHAVGFVLRSLLGLPILSM